MITTIVSYLSVALYAINIGLGIVILISAWDTLRPGKGVHLAWWHVFVITCVVWGWEGLFLVRVISDLRLFGAASLLPGIVPMWYLIFAFLLLLFGNVAFWLILKVQRGRRQLQRGK